MLSDSLHISFVVPLYLFLSSLAHPSVAVPTASSPNDQFPTSNVNDGPSCASPPQPSQLLDPTLANTTSGLFQGFLQPPFYNITAFLSIPYAAPPTGDLRFAAPKPYALPASDGPEAGKSKAIIANTVPTACHQLRYHALLESKPWLMPEREDCLTVSVWRSSSLNASSATTSTLAPVLIFNHGGGSTEGGTTPLLGHPMLNQHPDIIFVAFNYRLNIFGFPNPQQSTSSSTATNPVTPNAGLLDQRLAIEWLHTNIASFGGDPARMTILGHSAGSQSLGHYAFAHASDPLVVGMILWSGMPEGSLQDNTGVGWQTALKRTGCASNDSNSSEKLACLRDLPARDLLHEGVSYSMMISYDDFVDGWTPGVPSPDNVTNWDAMSGAYVMKGIAGEVANIPTWIQTTTHEGDNTVEFDTSQPSAYDDGTGAINRTQADLSTLVAFHCPAWLGAGTRLVGASVVGDEGKAGMGRVYRSVYNGTYAPQRPCPWMNGRSFHGEDAMLLLGDLDDEAQWWGEVTDEMREGARYLRSAVAAFVRDPVDGLEEELSWKAYEGGGR